MSNTLNLFSTPIGSYDLNTDDLSEWVLQMSKTEYGVQKLGTDRL